MTNFAQQKRIFEQKKSLKMLRKLTIFTLLFALVSCPDVAFGRKKKDKKEQQKPQPVFFEPKASEVDLPITNEMEQINGEWNVIEINET